MRFLLFVLPTNYLSFLFGKFTRISSPKILAKVSIWLFRRIYQIDLSEAEKDLYQFDCLNDFFTRTLKPNARSIGGGIVSPVDGRISEYGRIDQTSLIQVKGRSYNLAGLLRDQSLVETFRNGFFITIYLAPHNYHRIHSPVNGKVIQTNYISGKLWPVNTWAIKNIDGLFCLNERLISLVETKAEPENIGKLAVVKVGATNVGAIRLCYDDLITNSGKDILSFRSSTKKMNQAVSLAKGDELAVFELGSTVVLLFEKDKFRPKDELVSGEIQMGETLGYGS